MSTSLTTTQPSIAMMLRRPIRLPPGEKISRTGVYDLTMEEYHSQCCAGFSVSSSGIRTFIGQGDRQSPAHFYDRYIRIPEEKAEADDDTPDEEEESEALKYGRAAHHVLLGERNFRQLYTIRPEEVNGAKWQGNRTVCREWLAEQKRAGLAVLTKNDVETIVGIKRSLAAEPLVQQGILSGEIERSLIYQDEETGIWIKVRPDAIPNASGDYADLKTARSVHPVAISNSLYRLGYYMQAALVGMASEHVLGIKMNSFTFIFAEKKRPHCISIYTVLPDDLRRGERMIRVALRKMKICLETGYWPGPAGEYNDAQYLALPEKAQRDIDRYLKEHAA